MHVRDGFACAQLGLYHKLLRGIETWRKLCPGGPTLLFNHCTYSLSRTHQNDMRTVFQLLFGHQAKTGPVYISGALLFFSMSLSRKGENYAWSFRWQCSTNSLTR